MDTNNLYGHSMMQLPATEILDWVHPKDFYLENYSKNNLLDTLIEIDLNYLDEMFDLHSDYTLVGENIGVTEKNVCHFADDELKYED